MASPLVRIEGLSKSFDGQLAVECIDLAIAAGEFVVLLGPSGSGKTTLLSVLGGFLQPSAGRVFIDDADVTETPPARRPTATVFQDYALFPHMSVAGNVAFGLAMHKVPRPERERRVEEMLRLVGLEGFERRSVHQLSGGQRQRVALARAIAVAPRVLLLDEPLGALDLALRRQMQGELVRLQKRLGTTFVHVTHDQEEAMAIADRVVLLNRGRIEDVGPPERVYLRPASLFAATFMGESNILEGRVVGVSAERLRVETALGALPVAGRAEAGDRVHLSLRPEQIALAPGGAGDWVSLGLARIGEVTFQGAHLRCQALANAATTVLLRVPVGSEAAAGATVPLHVRAADIVLLKD